MSINNAFFFLLLDLGGQRWSRGYRSRIVTESSQVRIPGLAGETLSGDECCFLPSLNNNSTTTIEVTLSKSLNP